MEQEVSVETNDKQNGLSGHPSWLDTPLHRDPSLSPRGTVKKPKHTDVTNCQTRTGKKPDFAQNRQVPGGKLYDQNSSCS